MKYATAAATLLPLAWAANIDARAGKDTKFNVSNLETECDSDKGKCYYNFKVATGDSDSTSCKAETMTSSLGAAPETKCGPYAVSVAKPHDGGLIFIVDEGKKGLTGTFTVYPSDLKKVDSDGGERQSYKGGDAFDVAAKATLPIAGGASAGGDEDKDDDKATTTAAASKGDATESAKPSTLMSHVGAASKAAPTETESAKASSLASHAGAASQPAPTGASSTGGDKSVAPVSSIAATGVSGVKTMVTATASPTASGSDKSSSSSDSTETSSSSSASPSESESSGATRQSAFAGVMAVAGLIAFAF
ncbi:hypothetical protein PG999_007586 [Apiospora kogelbergensis]|uniref:Uncharacterized protein n=1 Tax=Apiospora kogelbergensis TaxID=1337665 RepID=A0AAW0QSN6_9PEZI